MERVRFSVFRQFRLDIFCFMIFWYCRRRTPRRIVYIFPLLLFFFFSHPPSRIRRPFEIRRRGGDQVRKINSSGGRGNRAEYVPLDRAYLGLASVASKWRSTRAPKRCTEIFARPSLLLVASANVATAAVTLYTDRYSHSRIMWHACKRPWYVCVCVLEYYTGVVRPESTRAAKSGLAQ